MLSGLCFVKWPKQGEKMGNSCYAVGCANTCTPNQPGRADVYLQCTCTLLAHVHVQGNVTVPGPGKPLGGPTGSPLSTREKNAALASRLAKSV